MRRCITLICFLFFGHCLLAQQNRIPYVWPKDSQNSKKYVSISALDSQVLLCLKSNSYESLRTLIPMPKDLKIIFDSLSMEQSTLMVEMKYKYMVQNIKKQYKRLLEQLEYSRFNLQNASFGAMDLDCGEHEMGFKFCYVIHECEYFTKTADLSYLAIKLNDCWFLGDELRLGRPKRKKKKNNKRELRLPRQFDSF